MASIIDSMEAAGATDSGGTIQRKGGKPPAPAGESKRDRFVRIIEPRVRKAIDAIRVVGLVGGSNKPNYDYGPSDVDAILTELTEAVAQVGDKLSRKPRQLKMFSLPRNTNGGD